MVTTYRELLHDVSHREFWTGIERLMREQVEDEDVDFTGPPGSGDSFFKRYSAVRRSGGMAIETVERVREAMRLAQEIDGAALSFISELIYGQPFETMEDDKHMTELMEFMFQHPLGVRVCRVLLEYFNHEEYGWPDQRRD